MRGRIAATVRSLTRPIRPSNIVLANHSPLHPVVFRSLGSVTPGEISFDPKILFGAAQEAKRLLDVNANHRRTTTGNSQSAMAAADALLDASRSLNPTLLKESSAQVATLHRAFLDLTSCCLDHIQTDETPLVLEGKDSQPLLVKALCLARRAHELDLPLHLPLCQQLMETVSRCDEIPEMRNSSAGIILEVSGWVASTMDGPLDALGFRSCLYQLIETGRLDCAHDVLVGMAVCHNVRELDLTTTVDILLLLKKAVKNKIAASGDSSEFFHAASRIVDHLESSIFPILNDSNSLSDDVVKGQVSELLGRMNTRDMASLLDTLFPESNEAEDTPNKNLQGKNDGIDPLDLAVCSILTEGVQDKRAKSMLSSLILYCRSEPEDTIPTRPRVKVFGTYVVEDRVYQALELDLSGEDDGDDDWDDRLTPGEMMYARTKDNDFPDVTGQFVHLGGSGSLTFTKEYESALWTRDYKEDAEFLEGLMLPDVHFDDDSSDDDDDF